MKNKRENILRHFAKGVLLLQNGMAFIFLCYKNISSRSLARSRSKTCM